MATTPENMIAAARLRAENFTLDSWDKVCTFCLTEQNLTLCSSDDEEFIRHYEVFTKELFDTQKEPVFRSCRNCLSLIKIGHDFIIKSHNTHNFRKYLLQKEKQNNIHTGDLVVSNTETVGPSAVTEKSHEETQKSSEINITKCVKIIPDQSVDGVELVNGFLPERNKNISPMRILDSNNLPELNYALPDSNQTDNQVDQSVNGVELANGFLPERNTNISSMRILDSNNLTELNSEDALPDSNQTDNHGEHSIGNPVGNLEQHNNKKTKKFDQETRDIIKIKKKQILEQLLMKHKGDLKNLHQAERNINVRSEISIKKPRMSPIITTPIILPGIIEILDDSSPINSCKVNEVSSEMPSVRKSNINQDCELVKELTKDISDSTPINIEIILPNSTPSPNMDSEIPETVPEDNVKSQNQTPANPEIYVRSDLFIAKPSQDQNTSNITSNIDDELDKNTSTTDVISNNRKRIRFSDEDKNVEQTVVPNVTPPKTKGILKPSCFTKKQNVNQATRQPKPINISSIYRATKTTKQSNNSQRATIIDPKINKKQDKQPNFSNYSQRLNRTINPIVCNTIKVEIPTDPVSISEIANACSKKQVLDSESARKLCDSYFNAIHKKKK